MRRIVGIIIFALGLLLLLARLSHLVQGVTGIAILGMFLGLVSFGLSFIKKPDPGPDAPPPLSPADRVTGVFYEPDRVFQNLRYHPRWLAAFLILVFFGVTYYLAFAQRKLPDGTTLAEKTAAETADRMIESGWNPKDRSPEEFKREQIEDAKSPVTRITGVFSYIGWTFLFMLVLAGLYLLLVLAFGGRMNFWQSMSVATYGSLPSWVILTVLNLILFYVKAPEDVDPIKNSRGGFARADLGLLFSPANHRTLYVIGSFIGIFTLYGWWVTVSGLHNTATKLSKASAWTIALLLWLLGLIAALILSAIFSSFMR